ncbi:MAG: molybdopterin molybdotransferase MoeA [Holophagales bacterium]|nr:MAG: molybdopterin molybdotransferase MoeA [Holophagales bacterium]
MLLTPEEGWRRLESHLAPLPAEWVPRRAARGLVLAAPLATLTDLPPTDVSAMDGYAFAGEVVAGDERRVDGRVAAGDRPGQLLAEGGALRIMTGAPVPLDADRIAPFEWTDRGRETVRFARAVPRGESIRRQAEVCRAGEPLLAAGQVLTPGVLSLLASQGYERVPAPRRPSVAILATGDEVVAPEAVPAPGQLRDSHSDFLLAVLDALGVPAVSLGISRDDPEELAARVANGLEHDLLLLCGGVSAGELDLVGQALERAGCETIFDGLAMQPGKPLVVARHARGLAFGLPGNPGSAMVAWWLFVRPALRRLLGHADRFWSGSLAAIAGEPIPRGKNRDRFLPARLRRTDGGLVATLVPSRGSHDLPSYAAAEALLRIAPGVDATPVGGICDILPLPGAESGRDR